MGAGATDALSNLDDTRELDLAIGEGVSAVEASALSIAEPAGKSSGSPVLRITGMHLAHPAPIREMRPL